MVLNGTALELAFCKWLALEPWSIVEEEEGRGGDTYSKWWFEKRLFLNVTLRMAVFCFTEKEVERENR